ncbi:DUF6059 family protein [Streptomyces sp. NPDC091265]|uniref:DUF6059 family protein n=1 Tax=unclassified Streptomyces TaxID=2593676 RepID=UPI00344BD599
MGRKTWWRRGGAWFARLIPDVSALAAAAWAYGAYIGVAPGVLPDAPGRDGEDHVHRDGTAARGERCGPPPGHPERLRPDLLPTASERELWRGIGELMPSVDWKDS